MVNLDGLRVRDDQSLTKLGLSKSLLLNVKVKNFGSKNVNLFIIDMATLLVSRLNEEVKDAQSLAHARALKYTLNVHSI